MYARQPPDSRSEGGLRLPGNYGGTAFRSEPVEPDPVIEEEPLPSHSNRADDAISPTAAQASPPEETVSVGSHLFSRGGGGIGFEELLILGLIFLISQNDTKDDLTLLLLLLLFIQ